MLPRIDNDDKAGADAGASPAPLHDDVAPVRPGPLVEFLNRREAEDPGFYPVRPAKPKRPPGPLVKHFDRRTREASGAAPSQGVARGE